MFLKILVSVYSRGEYVVYPNVGKESCSSCPTLQAYINNASLFTNNSEFLFMRGSYSLNASLSLENLTNVTWKSEQIKGAEIVLQGEGTLLFKNVKAFSLSGFYVHILDRDTQDSSVMFTLCTIIISNTTFNDSSENFPGSFAAVNSTVEFKGTMYFKDPLVASYSAIFFRGNSFFEQIHSPTIKLDTSSLQVTGLLNFTGSFQHMYIDDSSVLKLVAPVTLIFNKVAEELIYVQNIAEGAIHVQDNDSTFHGICQNLDIFRNMSCFFEIEHGNSTSEEIRLEFKGNNASTGVALYGGALKQCKVQVNGILENITGYEYWKNIARYFNSQTVTSEPTKLCFCTKGVPDCSMQFFSVPDEMVPGRKLNLSIAAMGQVNATNGYISVGYSILDISATQFVLGSTITPSGCNNITVQVLYLRNFSHIIWPNPNGTVYPQNCQNGNITFIIHLKDCPRGFTPSGRICSCEKALQDMEDVNCDVQTGLIENRGNRWFKPLSLFESDGGILFLWSNECPSGYCKFRNRTSPILIDFSMENGSDMQCANHRTGILCGACEAGHSLRLSSLNCDKCDNKFLSLVVLFALAGVGLIAILSVLHMTVASGTLNGIILYVNIININRSIFFPRPYNQIIPLTLFVSWLNLDLGISTCFYDGLDMYQYSWLQYAFPVYLWLLTGAIVVWCKCSRMVRKLLGTNPIAVLATVILMSYTKIIQTALGSLVYANLEDSAGNSTRKVWFLNGNLEYFHDLRHILLGITGICTITFLVFPYVFLLTFGYHLQAYSNRKGFRWFNRFAPVLDAHYAPFNKTTRFWPGLMLLVRIALVLSDVLYKDNLVFAASIMVVTIAFQNRLYRYWYLDALEKSFSLNLCIMCAGTYHIKLYGGNQTLLSSVCTGVALVEFVGILTFHLLKRFNSNCFQKISEKFFQARKSVEVTNVLKEADFNECREPLLDSGYVNSKYLQ